MTNPEKIQAILSGSYFKIHWLILRLKNNVIQAGPTELDLFPKPDEIPFPKPSPWTDLCTVTDITEKEIWTIVQIGKQDKREQRISLSSIQIISNNLTDLDQLSLF